MMPVDLTKAAIHVTPFVPNRHAIRPLSGPPPPDGFNIASAVHPIVAPRPVNVLSGGGRGSSQTPRQRESIGRGRIGY